MFSCDYLVSDSSILIFKFFHLKDLQLPHFVCDFLEQTVQIETPVSCLNGE